MDGTTLPTPVIDGEPSGRPVGTRALRRPGLRPTARRFAVRRSLASMADGDSAGRLVVAAAAVR
ncbi:hypothetical protein GCM10011594_04010 [Nakamurella endophytica]|uniref:Uncharacterized protein n=1 Tax=Nakamurella endophytica TaxID=1748367 RepID=A0A917SLA4_9ACTN|nr:hypothetical protein GCM10011594_04010 [Nakamurella endophytica]